MNLAGAGDWRTAASLAIAIGFAAPEPARAALPPAGKLEARNVAALPPVAFPDGASLSLRAFPGKIVLMNFWATWCVPCRTELPSLDELAAKRSDLVVIAASVDTDQGDAARDFARRYPHLKLGFASLSAVQRFGALGMPYSIIIDRNGREAARVPRALNWNGPDGSRFLRHAR